MADEATPDPIDGTPAEDATPDTGAPAPDPTDQKRYDDLRAEFNRKQNLWTRAQQGDIDAMRELQLPIDFGDDPDPDPTNDDDDPFVDPVVQQLAVTQRELAELKAWQAEQRATEAANNMIAHIEQLASEAGKSLSDADKEIVFARATSGEISRANTEAAFKAHLSYVDQMENQFLENYKVSKQAPGRPPQGGAGTKQPDLDTHQGRVDEMMSKLSQQALT